MRLLREGIHADSQQEAHAMQRRMPLNRWPHERGKTLGEIWDTEPDVGRVARDVPNRVDRLRALGNALVPQIAELIGRAILQAQTGD